MTGLIGEAAGYHAVLDCDVLRQLGADFVWAQFYPDRAKIIQIDLDPTHIGHRHPVNFGAVGNIRATLKYCCRVCGSTRMIASWRLT